MPTERFALVSGDESVNLTFTSAKPGADLLIVRLGHRNGAAVLSDEMFLTFVKPGESSDLEISWARDGQVTFVLKSPQSLAVSSAGETHRIKLSGAPSAFEISASTCEMQIKPVVLGHVQSP
jgi:hypothetical protein